MSRLKVFAINSEDISSLKAAVEAFLRTGSGSRRLPLTNTLQHIYKLKAKCLIAQSHILDPDFLAEHATYYSTWSLNISKYCTRLHFFSESPISVDVLDVVDQMAGVDNSYIGFITIRPITTSPVGATILRPLPVENSCYILSRDKFDINIAGRRFEVSGTPFMQQDNAVGACAQASIWMALRTLRRKEGNAAFSPAQITSAATRFMVTGRTLPNRGGLVVEQMLEAVRAAGYSPHIIPIRCDSPEGILKAKLSLYPYVESEIPVLMGLFPSPSEGHAVLLIGHGWDNLNNKQPFLAKSDSDISINIYDSSAWIEPFYINNDNSGPYLPLPESCQNGYSLKHAELAIPFLPADVFLDGDEAREGALNLFLGLLKDIKGLVEEGSCKPYPDIVMRTYLMDRSKFRSYVLSNNMPEELVRYYREKWLPKRVWITELNKYEKYNDVPNGSLVRVGEIILDPASELEDGAFLSIHLSSDLLPFNTSILIDRDAFAGTVQAIPLTNNGAAYSPLNRNS